MTSEEVSWLAGLLEGEGCFTVEARTHHIHIYLEMTDEDIVERVRMLTEIGSVSSRLRADKPGSKRIYRWQAHGDNAHYLMWLLRPLMGERRAGRIGECMARWNVRVA